MGLYNKASLIMYPSGVKSGKIYSQKPTDGTGDLTFTRASTATRVNSSGLIEDVASGVPRIDYSGGGCGRLLLEPQRTNLITYSEEFDNAFWTEVNATVTANDATSPDSTTTADKLVETATTSIHYITTSMNFTSGQTYTLSIYAKADTRGVIQPVLSSLIFGFDAWANFNLNTGSLGTVGSAATASITNVGNGWYRCNLSATATSTGSSGYSFALQTSDTAARAASYTGDGTSGIYIWGAQMEEGSYPTSYIPTSGAAVTRVADDAYATGLSSSIGQTEGTIYTEFKLNTTSVLTTGRDRVSISDGSTGNWIFFGVEDGNEIRAYLRFSGSVIFSLETNNSPIQTDTTYKLCLKYSSGDSKVYLNGTEILASTATYGSPSAPIDDFVITGANYIIGNSAQEIAKDLNQILLFPVALSDTELEELTTI